MSRITPYGKDTVVKVFVVSLLFFTAGWLFNTTASVWILTILAIAILAFTLNFFRDPERMLPEGYSERSVISPADGKIISIDEIENTEDNPFDKGERLIRICIFMSPLNVHVNRIPFTGKVTHARYVKGKYIVAFNHKSSEKNERTELAIESEDGRKVYFKQIAGFVARRIVCTISKNDNVISGTRFGMIKFGSRADIFIKSGSIIKVNIGETARAGETILAELK